jgi:hypothetical protein
MGAPEKSIVASLDSWTLNTEQGIKYFSGTATYQTTVNVPGSWFQKDSKLIIDLGKVGDMAEITVNDIAADTLWSMPFRCDITRLLKKGNNKLEVKVTNEWTNRLAGDRQAPAGQKVLNSSVTSIARQLNESGLMGPVRIFIEKSTLELH